MAGLVLANLFSLAAWGMFYRLVNRRWGRAAASWSLIFLIAFPGSLFFQFDYTESLFLLLVLRLWWALEQRRYGSAWLAGGLLPLTRGIGAFAVLPMAWSALHPMLRRRFTGNRRGDVASLPSASAAKSAGRDDAPDTEGLRDADARFRSASVWLLAAPLVGWGGYLALMWHWTGNPFEGFEAQKYWSVHSVSNLWNLPKFIAGWFWPTPWHEFRGSVLDRCVFVLLLDCLPLLWRLDKGLLIWTYMLGILPAMSGTFTSFTRFASCCFPMFIALGVFLSRREWRRPRYGLLAVFVILHVVLVWRFVNFRWAG